MKKTTLLLLLACLSTRLLAQDTANITLCKQFWKTGEPIYGSGFGVFEYLPSDPIGDGLLYIIDSSESCLPLSYITDNQPGGLTRCFEAWKLGDDPLNGVTLLDIAAISRHILGLEPLSAPYGIIAADVNKSGSITTLDIVKIKDVLLGISGITDVGKWAFLAETCLFPNPANPFEGSTCPCVPNEEILSWDNQVFDLTGFKIGDVDGDADPNDDGPGFTSPDSAVLLLPDITLSPGQVVVSVYLESSAPVGGLQLQFRADTSALQIDYIQGQSFELPPSAWSKFANGNFRVVNNPATVYSGSNIFNLFCTVKNAVSLSDVIKLEKSDYLNMGIDVPGEKSMRVNLDFSSSVAVKGPDVFDRLIGSAIPNPFSDKTFIPIRLESAETIRLEVYDLAGRLLYRSESDLPAGENRLEIPASALGAGHIGLYKISAGQQTATGKIVRR
jgi:hypothetical protein